MWRQPEDAYSPASHLEFLIENTLYPLPDNTDVDFSFDSSENLDNKVVSNNIMNLFLGSLFE